MLSSLEQGPRERPKALQTKPLEASRILFVTVLFIYLLPHFTYHKALIYRVLVFSRIGKSKAERRNSEIFQKFRSSYSAEYKNPSI